MTQVRKVPDGTEIRVTLDATAARSGLVLGVSLIDTFVANTMARPIDGGTDKIA